ncbi:MAG: hypothetical protein PUB19_05780 [Lachnospiraceae bacterium]|nr:hypothetical protein [Lachnospiraceae bacterium]
MKSINNDMSSSPSAWVIIYLRFDASYYTTYRCEFGKELLLPGQGTSGAVGT